MNKNKEALILLRDMLEVFDVNSKNYQDVGFCIGDVIPEPDKVNKLLKQAYKLITEN